jgi:hypothetical protein
VPLAGAVGACASLGAGGASCVRRAWLRLRLRLDSGRTWVDPVDLVLIVGDEGDDPAAGVLAARAYRGRSVTISGLIRRRPGTASTDSRTSDTLRPLCTTMMLVNDTGYLDDLLDALGVGE